MALLKDGRAFRTWGVERGHWRLGLGHHATVSKSSHDFPVVMDPRSKSKRANWPQTEPSQLSQELGTTQHLRVQTTLAVEVSSAPSHIGQLTFPCNCNSRDFSFCGHLHSCTHSHMDPHVRMVKNKIKLEKLWIKIDILFIKWIFSSIFIKEWKLTNSILPLNNQITAF